MATATTPFTGAYAADPIHSSFSFAVRYQGVAVFRGSLSDVDVTLADGRLDGAAKVESISIRTPEQFRAHILSADFFDADNHPEVRFSGDRVEFAEDGTASVAGELTLKGITRPVQATGTWQAPATDAFGGTRGGLQLEAVIDRTEFGMNWNMPLPSGGNSLANDVTLVVDLSLVEKA